MFRASESSKNEGRFHAFATSEKSNSPKPTVCCDERSAFESSVGISLKEKIKRCNYLNKA